MLTVWGRANSINVMKVLWTCEELGLEYQRVDAGLQHGVVDTPEYRARNPNGRVPTIDDDGFVLWESNTIVRYLAAKHAAGSLMPAGLRERADAERWMDWGSMHLGLAMTPLFWQLVRTPADRRNAELIASSTADAEAQIRVLDAHLADRPFVCGDSLTVGDIPAASFVHRWFALPIARPRLPGIERYYADLMKRPAYASQVALPLT